MTMTEAETVELVPTQTAPDDATQQPEVVEPGTSEAIAAQPDPEESEDKAVKRMERRIQRLTAQKYQTQAEAQQARQETEALRQKLAQYEQPEEKPQGPDPVALAREIARIEKISDKSNAVAREGAKRYADFDKAVQIVARDVGPLFDQIGRTTGLGEAVLAADDPATVLHAIGSDPDLAEELAGMSPIQQARRIARLEATLDVPKPASKSNAPKPLEPVKGATGATKDPSLMSDAEFSAWRKAQIKARSG